MENALSDPVRYIKGVGPKRAKSFAKAGINTLEDLLYYFPRRYEDRTNLLPIAGLSEGNTYTIKARIMACSERRSFRRGLSILEAAVADGSGIIFCVWFNQHYLRQYFKPGQELILYGKVERYGKRLQINSPEFELVDPEHDAALSIGRIVPIYSLPEGMTQRYLRYFVKHVLDEYLPKLHDFLPFDIRSRQNLANLAKSLLEIHFPENDSWRNQAYQRLAFDEFFIFQLPLALRKLKNKEKPGIRHNIEGVLIDEFIAGLPFKLTDSQAQVMGEIKKDMAGSFAMQRLLQGDVGSGKTVVATIAAVVALQGGYQAAIMVPTEILARQHYDKIKSQLKGIKSKNIKVILFTGSTNKKERPGILRKIKEGKVDLVIGTHALLEETVEFGNLGLVVIDEQHKFGVGQRSLLPKKGANPDILIMTATPIPRTLAITL
ncbi:MAG: DEAD/DEAH box helicase, partial [Candidatus Omnitrophota bacterium]